MRLLPTLVLLAIAAAPLRAEESPRLAELLPADCPFYFESRMPSAEEMRSQAMFRCLEEPAMKRFLERVAKAEDSFSSFSVPLASGRLMIRSDMMQSSLAVTVNWLDEKGPRSFSIRNSIAFAWVGLTEGTIPVDLVAGLEIESGAESALGTIQRILAAASLFLHESEGSIDEEVARLFRDEAYRERRYVRGTMDGVELYLVPIGRLLAVATSEARVRDMIDRTLDDGRSRPSFATDERHLAAIASVPGTGTVTGIIEVRVDRAIAALQPRFPGPMAMAAMWMQQVGLGKMRGITSVTRAEGSGVASATSVLIEGPKQGLARLFAAGRPVPLDGLEFAPVDSYYARCGQLDFPEIYQGAMEVGGMFLAMAAAEFEGGCGLRLKEDLIDLAGPDWTLIVSPTRGLFPDVAIVLGSSDAVRLEASLLKILSTAPWPAGTGVRTVDLAGVKAHVVPLGHPELTGVPVAPCFGVVEGKLLITPFPMTFARMVRVRKGETPGLAQNRDFAALRARAPEGAIGLSYLDVPRLVSFFYDTLMPFLQAMPSPGPQAPPIYEMPDARIIERHLFGRVGWCIADERGMHWHSYGCVDLSGPGIALVAAAGAALAFTAAPERGPVAVAAPVERAVAKGADGEAAKCEARARLLRGGLRLWLDEKGALPDTLEALRAQQVAEENFMVPGAGKPYVYFGPKGKGGVLLHGYPNGRDGGICIVTTELVLQRITEAELEALLRSEPAPKDR